MGRATIKDVARESGYSIAAVSLVLNHKASSIPQTTRNKILETAQRLAYRPSQVAVSMITKRSGALGLIIPDNSNLFFADLSKAIEEAAWQRGYSLIYGNSSNDPKRDLNYLQMFADRGVDGIIYTGSASFHDGAGDRQRCFAYINGMDIPVVTVDRQLSEVSVPTVVLNHFKGGYLATRHLLELGHTRIGCYTGPAELLSSFERLEGYRSALLEAGIGIDEGLFFEGDYQLGREEEALRFFREKKVTAVFAFNDIMALGLYRAAVTCALSIPGELSIVGFDSIPFSDIIHPGLTTVRQPVREMGACAVEVLLNMVEGNSEKATRPKYLFEPQLVVRGSTARPNSREC